MLVLVQDVREAGVRLLDLDDAARFELATEVEQQVGHLGAAAELALDPSERAAALPERAVLARATLGVALGDQLDRAELMMLVLGLHAARLPRERRRFIGGSPHRAAGRYGTCDDRAVDAFDLDVRRHVYFSIVANGAPPTVDETANVFECPVPAAEDSYRRLQDARQLVLFPGTTTVWFANPWCFAPTPHRVEAAGRVWTATCAWDALGIPGALHGDGRIESECACCGEAVTLEVRDGELVEGTDLLVHVLVPVRRWWDDIGFT